MIVGTVIIFSFSVAVGIICSLGWSEFRTIILLCARVDVHVVSRTSYSAPLRCSHDCIRIKLFLCAVPCRRLFHSTCPWITVQIARVSFTVAVVAAGLATRSWAHYLWNSLLCPDEELLLLSNYHAGAADSHPSYKRFRIKTELMHDV